MYMDIRLLQNTRHFYLYGRVIKILWDKYLILDQTKMNIWFIALSHAYMHERGNTRVLEGVDELRTEPFHAQGCKRNGLCFFVVGGGG
jgi:hypothetical protein